MPIEYVQLSDKLQPVEADAFRLPRMREVLDAARFDAEAAIVATYSTSSGDYLEALVLDVDCDAIPSRNAPGLRSPERFAILIGEATNVLPMVLALRKDFPESVHLNATHRGAPKWVCLYLAPPRDVFRTWTGANFLRQIRWWLVQTAEGKLHGADQPVEFPFFDSLWELIIPPNLAELRQQVDVRYFLSRVNDSAVEGGTLVLHAQPGAQGHPDVFGVAIIDAPAAEQTGRLRLPFFLGELEDDLKERGADLATMLREALGPLPTGGLQVAGASERFVLLVNFPVMRIKGGPIESTQQIALVAGVGRLGLGVRLGLYDSRNGIANNFALVGGAKVEEGDWRSVQVASAAVLKGPDSASFRQYSGVANTGPQNAVLVGAGSLGGELLNLWLRAGWGQWSTIDPDHLKPHNLARHIGFVRDLGKPKVVACDEFAGAIFGSKKLKAAIAADACDPTREDVAQLLDGADLVIDCSTKLDFPRRSSQRDRAARHVSMFLTPSGRGSVLLAEDTGRTTRLRNLESQYYRAIINSDWGAGHLEKHLGTFWSGASCRDISYELPFSSVVVQAGTLAERLPMAIGTEEASILVWERDVSTGAIANHTVEASKGYSWPLDPLVVHADEGLLAKLRQMRQKSLPLETGGILVGYHDLNLNEVHIVDALPAPIDSEHSEGHFDRGIEGIATRLQDIQSRTANVVSYIGEWHSHPAGHGAQQSRDDRIQAAVLAFGMAGDGLPFLQLIVGEGEIKVHGMVAKTI
jgi:hypothetical protein